MPTTTKTSEAETSAKVAKVLVDTADRAQVTAYVTDVFTEMTKKKTKPLLLAFRNWAVQQDMKDIPAEFDQVNTNSGKDAQLYNRSYSRVLRLFIVKYADHWSDLSFIARDLKDLNKISRTGITTFGPLLSTRDYWLLKAVFTVLNKKNHGRKLYCRQPKKRARVAASLPAPAPAPTPTRAPVPAHSEEKEGALIKKEGEMIIIPLSQLRISFKNVTI